MFGMMTLALAVRERRLRLEFDELAEVVFEMHSELESLRQSLEPNGSSSDIDPETGQAEHDECASDPLP